MDGASEAAFTVKELVVAMDAKLDAILTSLALKADLSEVRNVNHEVAGIKQQLIGKEHYYTTLTDMKRDVKELSDRTDTLERTQLTEESVAKALKEHQDKQRTTFRWAVSLLGSVGALNLILNYLQGFKG